MEEAERVLDRLPGASVLQPYDPDALRDVVGDRPVVLGDRDGPLARLEYVAMRGTVSLLARLPYRLRGLVIATLARIASWTLRERVGHAREFLRQAYGDELEPARRDRLVRGAFAHLCHVIVDDVARPRNVPSERWADHIEIEGDPEGVAAMRAGGPVVLISGHIGDWEASVQALALFGFGPLYVVGKPTKNKPVSAWIQRQREKGGVFMIPRYGAIETAQKTIGAGGSLGLVLDHRATSRPVLAPFFGRLACCERSTAILLRRLRVPALVICTWRTERPYHYRIHVERVIPPEESRRMKPEEVSTLLNQCFERMILAKPEQYFWLHDRYRGVEKTLRRAAKGKVRRVKIKKRLEARAAGEEPAGANPPNGAGGASGDDGQRIERTSGPAESTGGACGEGDARDDG